MAEKPDRFDFDWEFLQEQLGLIRDDECRARVQKVLDLWSSGYRRESLSSLRITAELVLRQLLESAEALVAEGKTTVKALRDADKRLNKGQIAQVIDWLYQDACVIPARVALHLHTLRSWGNFASHSQHQGHPVGVSDLRVLVQVMLGLEEFVATEVNGRESIFGATDGNRIGLTALRKRKSEVPGPAYGHAEALIQCVGANVLLLDHGLVVPHFSMELYWSRPPAAQPDVSIYRGLKPFDPADSERFFGRAALCDQLAERATCHPLLITCGASGVGKSSLLRAGLVPVMLDSGWTVLYSSDHNRASLAAQLQMLDRCGSCEGILLVLDQLERALFSEVDPEVSRMVMEILLPKEGDRVGLHCVVGIREDFLGPLYRVADSTVGAKRALDLHRPESFVAVRPLTPPETFEAINGPLEGTRISFDSEFLASDLLPSLADSSGVAPMRLQLVCSRLMEAARLAGSPVIGRDLYDSLGGTDQIIETHLDEALAGKRYEGVKPLATALLKVMTNDGTRRWVDLGDIWEGIAPSGLTADEVELETVLGLLIDDRLVITRADERGASAEYTLMHDHLAESLQSRKSARELEVSQAQALLDRAVADWSNPQTRDALNVKALRLVEDHWDSLRKRPPETARSVLRASRRARSIRRAVLGALLGAALMGLLFGVYEFRQAIVHERLAVTSEKRALEERNRTVDRSASLVLLRAQLALESDPTTALTWLRELPPGASRKFTLAAWTVYFEALKRGVSRWYRKITDSDLWLSWSFTRDGNKLFSHDRWGRIRNLWDTRSGKGMGVGSAVAMSADGRIYADFENSTSLAVKVIEAKSGKRLATLSGCALRRGDIPFRSSVALSRTGSRIAVVAALGKQHPKWLVDSESSQGSMGGASAGTIFLGTLRVIGQPSVFPPYAEVLCQWDLSRASKPVRHYQGTLEKPLGCELEFSTDLQSTTAVCSDTVKVLDAAGQIHTHGSPRGLGRRGLVTFLTDGRLVSIHHRGQEVSLWDVVARKVIGQAQKHSSEITFIKASPDKTFLAIAGWSSYSLWRMPSSTSGSLQRFSRVVEDMAPEMQTTAFSPDSSVLALLDDKGRVQLTDLASLQGINMGRHFKGHSGKIRAVAVSSGGKLLATVGEDKTVRVWDLEQSGLAGVKSDATQRKIAGQRLGVGWSATVPSPDGKSRVKVFWSEAADETMMNKRSRLVLDRPGTGLPDKESEIIEEAIDAVGFSPAGRYVVTSGLRQPMLGLSARRNRIWDAESLKLVKGPLSCFGQFNWRGFIFPRSEVKPLVVKCDRATTVLDQESRNILVLFFKPSRVKNPLTPFHHLPGKKVGVLISDQVAQFWDMTTGKPLGVPLGRGSQEIDVRGDEIILFNSKQKGGTRAWKLSSATLPGLKKMIGEVTNNLLDSPEDKVGAKLEYKHLPIWERLELKDRPD